MKVIATIARLRSAVASDRATWIRVPLATFLISRFAVLLTAYLGFVILDTKPAKTPSGEAVYHVARDSVLIDMGSRYDSSFYLWIAKLGYVDAEQDVRRAAFFPAYPLLIRGVAQVFSSSPSIRSLAIAGMVVSNLSLLVALILLFALTRLELGNDAAARRTILYIAIFPSAFFFSCVYTESTFLMFCVGALYAARRQHWLIAGLLAAAASATRVTGILMWGVLGLVWLRRHGWTLGRFYSGEAWRGVGRGLLTDWRSALCLLIPPLGLVAFCWHQAAVYGDPFAFKTVQALWKRDLVGPLEVLRRDLLPVLGQRFLKGELCWQTACNSACLLGGLALAPFVWRRLGAEYALFCLLSLLLPAMSSTMSLMRYVLVLFPLFMVLGQWGRREVFDRVWVVSSCVLLSLFTVCSVLWVFVA